MCVICIKEKGVSIKIETLIDMYIQNPDGCGVAFVKNGYICIKKTMPKNKKSFVRWINYLDKKDHILSKDRCVIFHLRIATSGKKNISGCHPYELTDSVFETAQLSNYITKDSIIFHNGNVEDHLYESENKLLKKYNDTSVFIKNVLAPYKKHKLVKDGDIIKLLRRASTKNRFCIFNSSGNTHLAGDWEKDGKLIVSNKRYLYAYYFKQSERKYGKKVGDKHAK